MSISIERLYLSNAFETLDWLPNRGFLPPEEVDVFKSHLYTIAKSNEPNAGDGLFAKVDIPKNTDVCDYWGYVVTTNEWEWFEKNCFPINTGMDLLDFLSKRKKLCIIGLPKYPASCVNHKGKQTSINVKFFCDVSKFDKEKRVFLPGFLRIKTVRDVKAGDEFYTSYGEQSKAILAMK